jgi:hypothetical protein
MEEEFEEAIINIEEYGIKRTARREYKITEEEISYMEIPGNYIEIRTSGMAILYMYRSKNGKLYYMHKSYIEKDKFKAQNDTFFEEEIELNNEGFDARGITCLREK